MSVLHAVYVVRRKNVVFWQIEEELSQRTSSKRKLLTSLLITSEIWFTSENRGAYLSMEEDVGNVFVRSTVMRFENAVTRECRRIYSALNPLMHSAETERMREISECTPVVLNIQFSTSSTATETPLLARINSRKKAHATACQVLRSDGR